MADPLKILEDLSVRARRDLAPEIDVSARVLSRLRGEVPGPAWSMAFVVSGAAVAALAVLIVSLPLYEVLTEPWSIFFVMAANFLP